MTTEIKETLESFHSSTDANFFISKVAPPILSVLENVPPSFNSTSMEHVSALHSFLLTDYKTNPHFIAFTKWCS